MEVLDAFVEQRRTGLPSAVPRRRHQRQPAGLRAAGAHGALLQRGRGQRHSPGADQRELPGDAGQVPRRGHGVGLGRRTGGAPGARHPGSGRGGDARGRAVPPGAFGRLQPRGALPAPGAAPLRISLVEHARVAGGRALRAAHGGRLQLPHGARPPAASRAPALLQHPPHARAAEPAAVRGGGRRRARLREGHRAPRQRLQLQLRPAGGGLRRPHRLVVPREHAGPPGGDAGGAHREPGQTAPAHEPDVWRHQPRPTGERAHHGQRQTRNGHPAQQDQGYA